jgi:hypothetical protein
MREIHQGKLDLVPGSKTPIAPETNDAAEGGLTLDALMSMGSTSEDTEAKEKSEAAEGTEEAVVENTATDEEAK